MAKRKPIRLNENNFLRLLLHINHTPLLPLLSHIQATYPTNTHPSLPFRTAPDTTTSTIRLTNLPSEHLSLYRQMFTRLTSTTPRFDLVFKGFKRFSKANATENLVLFGKAEGNGLQTVEKEMSEGLINLDGSGVNTLWGKRLKTSGIKFQPGFMVLSGLEKENVEIVKTGLVGEKWLGEWDEKGEEVEGIRCRVVGLGLCAKWPERYPEWKEDLYWGFRDDEDWEGQNERLFGEGRREGENV